MASSQVILITGATRSLGFSTLQALAPRLPSAIYLLGARTVNAGAQAVLDLKNLGITSTIEVLNLDVSSDESVFAAVETVKAKYGRLDILINNAGIARIPSSVADMRSCFDDVFGVNVTSVAVVTAAFLPLLQFSFEPAAASFAKVINISSARGSLTLSTTPGKLPPTAAVAYSVRKTALNALTVEMQKGEDASAAKGEDGEGGKRGVRYYVVSPGHLRTAFNGFRGTKDPKEGAEVVVELVCGEWEGGTFWEFEGGKMRKVLW